MHICLGHVIHALTPTFTISLCYTNTINLILSRNIQQNSIFSNHSKEELNSQRLDRYSHWNTIMRWMHRWRNLFYHSILKTSLTEYSFHYSKKLFGWTWLNFRWVGKNQKWVVRIVVVSNWEENFSKRSFRAKCSLQFNFTVNQRCQNLNKQNLLVWQTPNICFELEYMYGGCE